MQENNKHKDWKQKHKKKTSLMFCEDEDFQRFWSGNTSSFPTIFIGRLSPANDIFVSGCLCHVLRPFSFSGDIDWTMNMNNNGKKKEKKVEDTFRILFGENKEKTLEQNRRRETESSSSFSEYLYFMLEWLNDENTPYWNLVGYSPYMVNHFFKDTTRIIYLCNHVNFV